ncbi:MAG: ABC transporter ATP-binding protein [Oscillospiraceae bacterium]
MEHTREIIRCEHVGKEFDNASGARKVLDDISISVHENEFLVLFGPGQCGKTTLINMLSGLDSSTSGVVYLGDKPVSEPGPERGVVFQSISLFPWLTVKENVAFGPKCRGINRQIYEKSAQYFIDLVGLSGFESAYPINLSGGMKQRVGIARAYCNDPEVLFMDEPFGALDAQTRYMMEEEIERIWKKEKRTVVFVTNNIEEALYLADRIILMTNCPASIKNEYVIDLPRPREYTSPDFLRLRKEITEAMDKTL